ncbi:hypothetical protein KAR91_67475 [Candidatus Pacearchaeota archaeon]|nr:hypothetical protein [Candidatus Pacearchaeota archaeon]
MEIIKKALKGMGIMSSLFIMARDSGAYKLRKNYQVTDLELKERLDQGAIDIASITGKQIIVEDILQEHHADPKKFEYKYPLKTPWEVYQDQCIQLQEALESGKY